MFILKSILNPLQDEFASSSERADWFACLPWLRLWPVVWKLIPEPQTQGHILLALDDSITPKTGKKIFACHHFFDHAAKANQSKYPWSQNIVKLSLLKPVHKRWASLPLNYALYRPKDAGARPSKPSSKRP